MSYEDIDDLMQEAYFGLMAAVRGYGLGEIPQTTPPPLAYTAFCPLKVNTILNKKRWQNKPQTAQKGAHHFLHFVCAQK